MLDAALLGLRIEWGNGTNTTLEPWDKKYPSVIYVSHDRIALTLRPPQISWNLNELEYKPTVKFYGRDYPVGLPSTFRLRSLDPAVAFDQTIQLEWKQRERQAEYDFQMYRKASGPHILTYALSAAPNSQRQ